MDTAHIYNLTSGHGRF